MENILAFYTQVNDPFITDEMVLNKVSKAAKMTIGLALQNKPPKIGDICSQIRSVRIGSQILPLLKQFFPTLFSILVQFIPNVTTFVAIIIILVT